MSTKTCEPPMLGTIAKSGRVLALFTPRRPEWGVTEVARSLEMPKSGAHSQLSALTQIGVLRRTATSRYRLGWRLISLSHTVLETAGFRRQARQELTQIVAHAGKACSAWLAVRDGGEVISVDQAGGSESRAGFLTTAGRRLPAHCTAAGKLLLASSASHELELIDDADLQQLTAATITDRDELSAELARVRAQAIAWEDGETLEGISSLAAPVREPDGSIVAAISISGPTSLLERARLAHERLVVGAGRRTTEAMRNPFLVTETGGTGVSDNDYIALAV